MNYHDHVAALWAAHPRLGEELASFQGVSDLLAWMKRRGLCHTEVDLIGQDEFEYDFLIRHPDEGCWVAFGIT